MTVSAIYLHTLLSELSLRVSDRPGHDAEVKGTINPCLRLLAVCSTFAIHSAYTWVVDLCSSMWFLLTVAESQDGDCIT